MTLAFIELGSGYAIGTYPNGYIVGKLAVTFDSKSGKDREYIDHPHYFTSISECVRCAYKDMARDSLVKHRKNIDIEQAIEDMVAVERRMESLLLPLVQIEEMLEKEVTK